MKTIVLLAALFVSVLTMANDYEETMKINVAKLEKSTSLNEMNQLAALFMRISDVEKNEWLPSYYASYAYVRTTHFMHDADSIDTALDQAQVLLDDLLKAKPDESELHVLQAFIYQLRITGAMSGYKYSSLSNQSLEKAEQLNADNPRIYYCKGNNVYHTPAMFGGGAEKAQALFEKAKLLFEAQSQKNELLPHWGSYHNEVMLQKCLAEK
ncbi:hypothetical protein [Carboxylicivirga linearis]|uniref:Tetratricopeptide repeat protein n=1 Tax=Carboxylicivirga linearis TaxID=1628157 RepID=A0ABS5JR31_9BACT|nr:hypothetical protein [Carboxylicivirga linearis]MBS2097363.1 hypothetical protein [Carboxylicivirga linearis]